MLNLRARVLGIVVAFMAMQGGQSMADPLAVREERLGAWHYLYPMEFYGDTSAMHRRATAPPTALAFGKRVAVMVPGSDLLAEWVDGRFEDLKLPGAFTPVSLAADQAGTLVCLAGLATPKSYEDAQKRWFVTLRDAGWDAPVEIPLPGCDRLEFDSQNRIWALGEVDSVAVWAARRWTTHRYSEEKRRAWLPVRIGEATQGDVILFSYAAYPTGEWPGIKGTLTYRDGHFISDPKADTSVLCGQEWKKQWALSDDWGFAREKGYVCRKRALNGMPCSKPTVLRSGSLAMVSFGNDGLAWAIDPEAQPDLPTDEWEAVNDVAVPPAVDLKGNLWIGRADPPRILVYSKEKTAEIQGDFHWEKRGNSFLFDQLGRAWISSRNDGVILIENGVLTRYANFTEAFQAENEAYPTGWIFPWAVKTPDGRIAFLDDYDSFAILDRKGKHAFQPAEIDPTEPNSYHPRHGYNPFRESFPWYDKAGRIYANVNGTFFRYEKGKWMRAPKDAKKDSALPGPPAEPPKAFEGRLAAFQPKTYETWITSPNGRSFVFKGFHFYEAQGTRLIPFDTGLNPLASYPFWGTWYESPGLTTPVIDPQGRLWISPVGPYADDREWYVSRPKDLTPPPVP